LIEQSKIENQTIENHMATLRLEIVTPEARTYSDDVESVVIPGAEGELGITKNGEETRLAVGEGFVEVTGEKVSVLTDMAVPELDIDESAAEEAMRRAEAALNDEHLDEEGHAAAQAAMLKSLAQLRVKRRKHV